MAEKKVLLNWPQIGKSNEEPVEVNVLCKLPDLQVHFYMSIFTSLFLQLHFTSRFYKSILQVYVTRRFFKSIFTSPFYKSTFTSPFYKSTLLAHFYESILQMYFYKHYFTSQNLQIY